MASQRDWSRWCADAFKPWDFYTWWSVRRSVAACRGLGEIFNDGRNVEVVAEGRRADLESLPASLREGPSGADVDAVDTDWMLALGQFRGFGVRA